MTVLLHECRGDRVGWVELPKDLALDTDFEPTEIVTDTGPAGLAEARSNRRRSPVRRPGSERLPLP